MQLSCLYTTVWILTVPASLGGRPFCRPLPLLMGHTRGRLKGRVYHAALSAVLASGPDVCNFSDQLLRGHLAAIALDRAQGLCVSLGGIGQAGIADLCDHIAQIAGIANGAFHAADHHCLTPKLRRT